jgi:hypothetical protein
VLYFDLTWNYLLTTASNMVVLYQELDVQKTEIRLISLNTSPKSTGVIECSLQTFDLHSAPAYYALSYLWGDPNDTAAISVNGTELKVTTNLLAFFHQLQELSIRCVAASELVEKIRDASNVAQVTNVPNVRDPIYLWADAICINQSNHRERGHQVKMMCQIYENSSAVIGWMGIDTAESIKAIAAVQLFARATPQLRNSAALRYLMSQHPEIFNSPGIWAAIADLWQREYWRRTWVVQELVVNSNVLILCGRSSLTIEEIYQYDLQAPKIRALDNSIPAIFVGPAIDSIILFRDFWRGSSQSGNLSQFYPFCQARTTRCTDLRDKVYGVLGMTNLSIDPDYTLTIPVIYTDIAHKLIQREGLTFCFGDVGSALRRTPGIPSWVPDWSYEDWNGWDHPRWSGVDCRPQDGVSFVLRSDIPEVLRVFGVQVAEIPHIEQSVPQDQTEKGAALWAVRFAKVALNLQLSATLQQRVPVLQALLRLTLYDGDILSMALRRPRLHITHANYMTLAAAFLKVLCCAALSQLPDADKADWIEYMPEFGVSNEDSLFSVTFCQQFLGVATSPPHLQSFPATIASIDEGHCQWLRTRLMYTIEAHHFFITGSGFLGVAPGARVGDLVFAIKGCKMPVILRSVGAHYELVGPTLIPGIMDGELFEDGTFNPDYGDVELR